MSWFLLLLLIFSPAILAAVVSLYLAVYQKKEQRDEREYLDSLTEEEKKEYALQKNQLLTSQQKCLRVNALTSNNRIV